MSAPGAEETLGQESEARASRVPADPDGAAGQPGLGAVPGSLELLKQFGHLHL